MNEKMVNVHKKAYIDLRKSGHGNPDFNKHMKKMLERDKAMARAKQREEKYSLA